MARQVLPIVGAAIGGYIGGPQGAQIGFAIGSVVGNAVDPLEVAGNKVGDNPLQTASEGGARAIVFGKGCIRATCLIANGNRRVVNVEEQQSKGGGPVTINQRVYRTFAIALGEAMVGGSILRIWQDEKLVYDITTGSSILQESDEFSRRFRFYDGAEDQLPDPDLEVIYGDDTPYFRGTAYVVFPNFDLTDYGERIPTFRWEVATSLEVQGIVGSELTGTYTMGGTSATSYIFPLSNGNLGFAYAASAVSPGGSFTVGEIDSSMSVISSENIGWSGSGIGDNRLFFRGIREDGTGISADENSGFCEIFKGGAYNGYYIPTDAAAAVLPDSPQTWWYAESFYAPEYGGLIWFGDDGGGYGYWYLGVRATGNDGKYHNRLIRFPVSVGDAIPEDILHTDIGTTTNPKFWMSRSRDGNIHIIEQDGTYRKFDEYLTEISSEILPFPVTGANNNLNGFGIDYGVIALVYGPNTGGTARVEFRSLSDWSILDLVPNTVLTSNVNTRVIFTGDSIYFQSGTTIARTQYQVSDKKIHLYDIVSAIHERVGQSASQIDVSELTDLVSGVVFEATITGGEAINSILPAYFADPSEYDRKVRYIKRGKPVVRTLSFDDLIEEPETSMRENAVEYPKKLHLFFQSSVTGYAATKATSSRNSPDIRVVGEGSISVPVTFDDADEPAQISAKLHKVLWTDAEGEITWQITDEHLDLVEADCVGLSLRGIVRRARISSIEDDPGQRKLKMRVDRQSAYTSEVTGVPLPTPTPPQPSIISQTVNAFLDIPALTDDADDLHYLDAMSGATDVWTGAILQRSLDAGANFSSVASTTSNAVMGILLAQCGTASPYYTDTTNRVRVQLYIDGQLSSLTDSQFLSEQGAFVLSWEDSGATRWEIMQYRDAEDLGGGLYELTTLHRGVLNSDVAEHSVGATFVLLNGAVEKISAQSAWIDTELTHRAVSNGRSPESAAQQTDTWTALSQTEWPVAHVGAVHAGDDLVVTPVPRHRFGTDVSPIRSINWEGYRITATDGSNMLTADTTTSHTFDVTGWASPITVTVSQLNRFTGAGPSVSEEIP